MLAVRDVTLNIRSQLRSSSRWMVGSRTRPNLSTWRRRSHRSKRSPSAVFMGKYQPFSTKCHASKSENRTAAASVTNSTRTARTPRATWADARRSGRTRLRLHLCQAPIGNAIWLGAGVSRDRMAVDIQLYAGRQVRATRLASATRAPRRFAASHASSVWIVHSVNSGRRISPFSVRVGGPGTRQPAVGTQLVVLYSPL